MTQGKFKIKIANSITEQSMMENCLNKIGSGYDPTLEFMFYVMGTQLEGYKTMYYLSMIQDTLNKQRKQNE